MKPNSIDRRHSLSGISVRKVVLWLKFSRVDPTKLIAGFLRHRDARLFAITSAERLATGKVSLTLSQGRSSERVDAEGLIDRRWWKEFLLSKQVALEIEQANARVPPETRSEWNRLKEVFKLSRPDLVCLEPEGAGFAWSVYRILVRLDSSPDEVLDDETIGWLQKKSLYTVLGIVFDRRFASRKSLWDAAMASAFWRKVGLYREALRSTHLAIQTPDDDLSAKAACYVSRAAVFKDLKRYSEASECLWQAELYGGDPGHIASVRRAIGGDG